MTKNNIYQNAIAAVNARTKTTKAVTAPVKIATVQLELDTANAKMASLNARIKTFETEVSALSSNNLNLAAELSLAQKWGWIMPILGVITGTIFGAYVF